ncbi:DUF4835 family protein [Paraflavisolibacter sp. H34]|uniref:type IX secretion system protein PorD n=1 Tax=Huijunlia imazamoxiresistens TaxID=3127457 RepID=UPI00301756D7
MKKILFAILLLVLAGRGLEAQELQARLTIQSGKISSNVNKKVFQTLQTALNNFLSNRKWTGDTYQPNEKIKCHFLISIDQDMGENVYKASLTVQAARPVYNTAYESPLVNFVDNDYVFRYVEFQPVEFNENRVQGNDPLAANLTAVLAYYVNIIIGLDYDSFSARGGDPYFQKAQNIVNNAPESRDIIGWKTFDGVRNRYRLAENLVDSRYTLIHDAVYGYYRQGMDLFSEDEEVAREGILAALVALGTLNQEFPNSMILQFFFQGKSTELVKIFSRAKRDTRVKARDLLTKLDVTNANDYKELK